MSAYAAVKLIVLAGYLHDHFSLDEAQPFVVKERVQTLVHGCVDYATDFFVHHTYRKEFGFEQVKEDR